MASELSYSPGQRLRATLVAIQMGSTVRTVLKQWEPVKHGEHPDDARAMDMVREVMEQVRAKRKAAHDKLKRERATHD